MTTISQMMVALGLATILPLLVACRRSQAESPAARVDKLFAAWNSSDSPGCAAGISRNGTIVYEHAYGMANLELHVPITPETVFVVAPVTKSFTAMSVLMSAQRGQLSLDDEVQKYIPEWRDREDHTTIRHLLTHTSGLRDAFALVGWAPLSESTGDFYEAIATMLTRQCSVLTNNLIGPGITVAVFVRVAVHVMYEV